jgi:hypothetical protein
MYRLDPNTDLRFLLGRRLLQVAVARDELILRLDRHVEITLRGDAQLTTGSAPTAVDNYPDSASAFCELLGRSISDYRIDGDGALHLRWHPSGELILFADSPDFESYSLTQGGRLVLI